MGMQIGRPRGLSASRSRLAALVVAAVLAAAAGAPPAGAALHRTAASGDLLWSMRVGGSTIEGLLDVARTPDGGVVAVGTANRAFSTSAGDGLVVKYAAAGTQQWAMAYDDGDAADDGFWRVAVAPDGGIVAAGEHHVGAANSDLLVVKYSASGARLWSASIHSGGSYSDRLSDVVVDSAGDVCVVGTAHVPGDDRLLVARLDGSTGLLAWSLVTYGPGLATSATGVSAAASHDGVVYVAGTTASATWKWRLLLMRIDPSGSVAWTRAWRPSGSLSAGGRPWRSTSRVARGCSARSTMRRGAMCSWPVTRRAGHARSPVATAPPDGGPMSRRTWPSTTPGASWSAARAALPAAPSRPVSHSAIRARGRDASRGRTRVSRRATPASWRSCPTAPAALTSAAG